MPAWLIKLLGINFKTTLAGITALLAVGAAIIAAWKSKDFKAIFNNLPTLFTTLAVVLTALGLIKAKDQNVTGTGSGARSVSSEGEVTNREGELVGQQRPPDAGKV